MNLSSSLVSGQTNSCFPVCVESCEIIDRNLNKLHSSSSPPAHRGVITFYGTQRHRSYLPHGLAQSRAINFCQRKVGHHWCVALPIANFSLPDVQRICQLSVFYCDVGAKNREQIYNAFENIYPVTQKFRKIAEQESTSVASSS